MRLQALFFCSMQGIGLKRGWVGPSPLRLQHLVFYASMPDCRLPSFGVVGRSEDGKVRTAHPIAVPDCGLMVKEVALGFALANLIWASGGELGSSIWVAA